MNSKRVQRFVERPVARTRKFFAEHKVERVRKRVDGVGEKDIHGHLPDLRTIAKLHGVQTPKAVAVLEMHALANPYPIVQWRAVEALGKLKRAKARLALSNVATLADDAQTRIMALNALSQTKDARWLPIFDQALEVSSDRANMKVADTAVYALRALGTRKAFQAIAKRHHWLVGSTYQHANHAFARAPSPESLADVVRIVVPNGSIGTARDLAPIVDGRASFFANHRDPAFRNHPGIRTFALLQRHFDRSKKGYPLEDPRVVLSAFTTAFQPHNQNRLSNPNAARLLVKELRATHERLVAK